MHTELAAWIAAGAAVASAVVSAMINRRTQLRTGEAIARLQAQLSRDLERERALQALRVRAAQAFWTALDSAHQRLSALLEVNPERAGEEVRCLNEFASATRELILARGEAECLLPQSEFASLDGLSTHYLKCEKELSWLGTHISRSKLDGGRSDVWRALSQIHSSACVHRPAVLATLRLMLGAEPDKPEQGETAAAG